MGTYRPSFGVRALQRVQSDIDRQEQNQSARQQRQMQTKRFLGDGELEDFVEKQHMTLYYGIRSAKALQNYTQKQEEMVQRKKAETSMRLHRAKQNRLALEEQRVMEIKEMEDERREKMLEKEEELRQWVMENPQSSFTGQLPCSGIETNRDHNACNEGYIRAKPCMRCVDKHSEGIERDISILDKETKDMIWTHSGIYPSNMKPVFDNIL